MATLPKVETINESNDDTNHHYPGPNECIVYWNYDGNGIHNVHQFSDLIPILKEKICDKIGSKPVHFRIYSSSTNITQQLQDAFDINGINHMHISSNYHESVNKRILIDVMMQLFESEKYKQSKCIALISNDEALSHLLSKIHKEPTISHCIYISFDNINHSNNFVHNIDFVIHYPLQNNDNNNTKKRKHSEDGIEQTNATKKQKLNPVQTIEQRVMAVNVDEQKDNQLKNEKMEKDDDSDGEIIENIMNTDKEQPINTTNNNMINVATTTQNNMNDEEKTNLQTVDKQLHSLSQYTNSIDEMRASWRVNSLCMIYSRSKNEWIKGIIVKIETIDGEEWLTVDYGTKYKEMRRHSEHIKPMAIPQTHTVSSDGVCNDILNMPKLESDSKSYKGDTMDTSNEMRSTKEMKYDCIS